MGQTVEDIAYRCHWGGQGGQCLFYFVLQEDLTVNQTWLVDKEVNCLAVGSAWNQTSLLVG